MISGEWYQCRRCSAMIVTNLNCSLDWVIRSDPTHPVDPINLEFFYQQILDSADNDAVCLRIEINDIARSRRASRQSLTLSNGEHLNSIMHSKELAIEIVNATPVKFIFLEMRAKECLVVLSWNETDFLAVGLVRDL